MIEKFWDARTFRILFTALLFAMVLLFLDRARGTLTLFLFSVLFAYFLDPLVSRLEGHMRNRLGAIAVVYAILTLCTAALVLLTGPRIAQEAKQLGTSIPGLAAQASSGQLLHQIGDRHHLSPAHQQQLQNFFLSHKDSLMQYAASLATRLETPLSHLWWIILIPILSFFFLNAAPGVATAIVDLGKTHDEKGTLSAIVADVNLMLGSYIRAQLILAALTAVILTGVIALMRVPYAFILGPIAGLCELVPFLGPAVASALIWGLAILMGYDHVGWLFFALGGWRVMQDYVNAPRIMGRQLEMPPLATIFGVLAGGEVGGVIGALIAVPTIAILRILWRRLSSEAVVNATPLPSIRVSQLPDKSKS